MMATGCRLRSTGRADDVDALAHRISDRVTRLGENGAGVGFMTWKASACPQCVHEDGLESGGEVHLGDAGSDGLDKALVVYAGGAVHDEGCVDMATQLGDTRDVEHCAGAAHAVNGADRDGQRIDSGLLCKAPGFGGVGEDCLPLRVGGMADLTQLRFGARARRLSSRHNLPRSGHVLSNRERGPIKHDRGEPGFKGRLTCCQVRSVIKVKNDGSISRFGQRCRQHRERAKTGVSNRPGTDLHDDWRSFRLGSSTNGLDHLQVENIERWDRVGSRACRPEHVPSTDQAHALLPLQIPPVQISHSLAVARGRSKRQQGGLVASLAPQGERGERLAVQ